MVAPSSMLLQIFAAWPEPGAPAWITALPMSSRNGLGLLEALVRTADHEGQRAGLGRGDAARDRRVDHRQAGGRRFALDGLGGGDVDGRAIDQDRGLGR